MADGAIRNQPWCRNCRSGAGAGEASRVRRSSVEPVEAELATADAATCDDERGSRNVAAEVAAALAAGRR